MAMIEAIDLKRKMFFELDGVPYHCLDVDVSTPTARGGQTLVRVKLRNLLTRAVFDRTFKAGDKLREPDLEVVPATFLYSGADGYHFIDQESYETLTLQPATLGNDRQLLVENVEVQIEKFNGRPIGLQLPPHVEITVACTTGVRGDTTSGNVTNPPRSKPVSKSDAAVHQAGRKGPGAHGDKRICGKGVGVSRYLASGSADIELALLDVCHIKWRGSIVRIRCSDSPIARCHRLHLNILYKLWSSSVHGRSRGMSLGSSIIATISSFCSSDSFVVTIRIGFREIGILGVIDEQRGFQPVRLGIEFDDRRQIKKPIGHMKRDHAIALHVLEYRPWPRWSADGWDWSRSKTHQSRAHRTTETVRARASAGLAERDLDLGLRILENVNSRLARSATCGLMS